MGLALVFAAGQAAEAKNPAWLDPVITAVGVVITGLLTVAGNWVVKRMSRDVDEATAGLARTETVAAEVAVIRDVLAEVRTQQDRDREHAERERKAHQARLDAIIATLAEHQSWDRRAAEALRTIDPNFPAPPPLHLD